MELILVFALGEERYALEVAQIQEVVEAPALFFVPRAPDLILGAVNFHSQVMPVFDLGRFLDLGDGRCDRDIRVVVLAHGGCRLALAVQHVEGFRPLLPESVIPESEERRTKTYIRAVQSHGDDMINLLDLERLLADMASIFEPTGGERGA